MKQPINKSALRKAGGPAKNPPVKTTGNAIVRVPRNDMHEYDVRDAMRTLTRAEEIRGDKRMMGEVKRMAQSEAAKLKKIC